VYQEELEGAILNIAQGGGAAWKSISTQGVGIHWEGGGIEKGSSEVCSTHLEAN